MTTRATDAPPTRRLARTVGLVMASAFALTSCEERIPDGAPLDVIATFGEMGRYPGQFSYPRAMDVDRGDAWIVDKNAHVQRFDGETGEPTAFWQMPDWELGKPTGVTIAPGPGELYDERLVYVPDTHYHRVMIFRPPDSLEGEPELIGSFGEFGQEPGQFIYPTDVAVLTGDSGRVERIYVSEYGGNDRVSVFGPSFELLFTFGQFDEPSGDDATFSRPQSMELDLDRRELIITDACHHRIGRFTLDGELIAWIGGEEAEAGDEASGLASFYYPYGLELLGDGTALVCEFAACRVQHVDLQTGRSLGVFGTPGRGDGELANPWAVGVVGDSVLVLDSGNNRVIRFRGPRLPRDAGS